MDEYQPARFRSLLLLVVAVVVAVVLIWLIISIGIGLGVADPSQGAPNVNPPYVPGVIPGN